MNKPVILPKQTRKKFAKAFKEHAVELWLNSGKSATEVAAEVGIHGQRLSAWRNRFGPPHPGGKGAAHRSAVPSNWRSKTLICGVRTIISVNNGIF